MSMISPLHLFTCYQLADSRTDQSATCITPSIPLVQPQHLCYDNILLISTGIFLTSIFLVSGTLTVPRHCLCTGTRGDVLQHLLRIPYHHWFIKVWQQFLGIWHLSICMMEVFCVITWDSDRICAEFTARFSSVVCDGSAFLRIFVKLLQCFCLNSPWMGLTPCSCYYLPFSTTSTSIALLIHLHITAL